MLTTLPLLGVLVLTVPEVRSICAQVGPVPSNGAWERSLNQNRAVVLIHGHRIHLSDSSVALATHQTWQKPDSLLVKELTRQADVFAFAYGQNVSVDTIVAKSSLKEDVGRLKKQGYRDIVLIGYSAGGVIARHFVEDHPDAGVTKVIQVAVPNAGTPAANVPVPRSQHVFTECLTEECRQLCLKARADRKVPRQVQFACVLCRPEGQDSDGVVPCASQWTADLQAQGIPVTLLPVIHRVAPRSTAGAKLLADLVVRDLPRWDGDRVAKEKKDIFGK